MLAAAGGQLRAGARSLKKIVLPKPADAAKALPTDLAGKVPGISPLRTPTAKFYRVDTNLVVPQVDADSWTLEIDGMVEKPFSMTLQELLAMPMIERDITMTCVSNEVGGGYVGAARWLGVRLTDVLDRAGVKGSPDQLLSTAVDGFTISTPLEVVRDGRDAMIAVGMNGAPLTDTHGFPARLITPGLYGFVGATKWLTKLTLTTYAAEQAYWTKRQWATDAPIKTSARIDTPAPLSTVKAGSLAIGGVAWAQHRGVGKVEVKIDDGPWQETKLGPAVNVDYWRQWYLPWDAKPGLHRLAVRAFDNEGRAQLHRARDAVPERLERHPGGRRDRRVSPAPQVARKKFSDKPIRFPMGTESHMTVHHPATQGVTDMKTLKTRTGLVALAIALPLSLAACGSSSDNTSAGAGNTPAATSSDSMTSSAPMDTPSDTMTSSESMDASSAVFGAGCAAVPKDGAGSFNGMATEPVADRRERQPAALDARHRRQAGRPRRHPQLGSRDHRVRAGQRRLRQDPGRRPQEGPRRQADPHEDPHEPRRGRQARPDQLAGDHKTLAGTTITVKGSGEDFTVGKMDAKVICGNVPTANATVYIIDGVLMP